MSDRIERTIMLAAPIDRVWRAISDHREFGTWFRVALDQPFAVGTRSTGRMTYPGYEHLPWVAEIVAIREPDLLSYRWPPTDADDKVREDWPWTSVEFRLTATDHGTQVTIVESGFDALPAEIRESYMRSNEGGWTEQMQNIRAHVEG